MKLKAKEQSFLFSNTTIPDVFFAEYLSSASGDFVKVYLYLLCIKYSDIILYTHFRKKLSAYNNGIIISSYKNKVKHKNRLFHLKYYVKATLA